LIGLFSWVEVGLSSNSILRGGEKSSSYWPFFTLQINAARNNPATVILAINKINIALIVIEGYRCKSIFPGKGEY
jgi:hypothetical protein